MSETAMMASNRHPLAPYGSGRRPRCDAWPLDLLGRTDKMLGVILLGNNLVNAAARPWCRSSPSSFSARRSGRLNRHPAGHLRHPGLRRNHTRRWLGADLCRLAGVRIGLRHLAAAASSLSGRLVRQPVRRCPALSAAHLKPKGDDENSRSVVEELRSLVLESSNFIPQQHRSILLNLFELEQLTVEDIMTPRGEIEAIDIGAPLDDIKSQLATSFHTRVAVYENDPANVVGVLHQKRLLAEAFAGEIDHAALRARMSEPYFIPAATPIYTQLQFFRENRQRMGLVVDEYGEIEGLVTLEDIIEELVGKFTTRQTDFGGSLSWNADGVVLVDGAASLRDLNRMLALDFPLDGPRTLNGLIVEHLQDIPRWG
jgi:Mg2+/Co2+ transporter CorB